MGGGGSAGNSSGRHAYYDRDVSDRSRRTAQGTTPISEQLVSRQEVDPRLLPMGRRLVCNARSPIAYDFDITGSMGNKPKIIVDKMPLIAGQVVIGKYLDDPMMSIGAIGDAPKGDKGPIQIADFDELRKLDAWFSRVWVEGGGGGNGIESYELAAYQRAFYCDIPDAVTPFYLITGDEGVDDSVSGTLLREFFGGECQTTSTQEIYDVLKKKFKGNVFRINFPYGGGISNTKYILQTWRELLGGDHVLEMRSDLAIGDVTLGIFALIGGSRTLDQYCVDMRELRAEAQTEQRIAEVRETLKPLQLLAHHAHSAWLERQEQEVPNQKEEKKGKQDPKKKVDWL